MKTVVLCLSLILSTSFLWAQNAPNPAPPQTPPPPGMHHGMHHDMDAMQQHMQEMKAQVEKMRATLEQMKANLAKVKDPALKQQSQFDVDLWESMVKHMEGMVSMMSQGGGPGMGMGMMHGGMHHGMGCCAGMKDGGCCGDMKPGAGCCCCGDKCTRGPASTPAPDKPAQQ